MKRFCYRKPKFPRHGFVACLLFEKDHKIVMIYPLTLVYTSMAEFRFDMTLLHSNNSEMDGRLSDIAVALPITFEKTWPLKREYWEHPSTAFSSEDRQKLFFDTIENPSFYTLLATPYHFEKNYTQIAAVCPFLSNSSDIAIETFMKNSNYPVPQSASQAALYKFEKPQPINWKKGTSINIIA